MNNTRTHRMRSFANVVGVCGSTICALHCLFTPLLLVTGTALPVSFLEGESFHRAMILVVIPSATIAFGLGCWRHKDRTVLLLGLIGLAGLILSATLLHDMIGSSGERLATVASSVFMVTAHLRNWKLCRADTCTHDCDND